MGAGSRAGEGTGRRVAWIVGIGVSLAAACVVPVATAQQGVPRYHARGMDSWDFWYAKLGDLYYAFYLQSPRDAPVRFTNSAIGLATSRDLVHWTEYGEVLRAREPGHWNDAWMATGSTWWNGDHWAMVFTGQTNTGHRGVGLARSDDLKSWTRVGEGPVPLVRRSFVVPTSDYWQSRGRAAGTRLTYTVLADPYVVPEPIDGWFYLVINALLDGAPVEQRGCVGMFRSRDGLSWEDVGIVAAPGIFDQMEAPQLWKRGDRWYLCFGAARIAGGYRATMVYVAPTMFGPFEPSPRAELKLPDRPGWFYVAKVVTGPDGRDLLLANVGGTLSHPYPVAYEDDGSLTLSLFDAPTPRWVPGGLSGYGGGLVSDMAGGVIANGAARLNAKGYAVWGPIAAPAATAWVSDGAGGAIGAATDAGDLELVLTTAAGQSPWGSGTRVCNAVHAPSHPAIAADGQGGAFVAWLDRRSGEEDVYVQHVDGNGHATWTADGVGVCTATGAQRAATVTPDGAGGAWVAWEDGRSVAVGGGDVYAQHLDAAGVAQWAHDGVAVCAQPGAQESPVMMSDGAAGAFVAWTDARAGTRDIAAQHLGVDGASAWTSGGVLVTQVANDQSHPVLAPDAAGGVFVAWEDARAGGDDGVDVYAQRLGPAGDAVWRPDGVPIVALPGRQIRPSLVSDGVEGAVVAWMDARHSAGPMRTYTPYAQRVDPAGTLRWPAGGVRVEYGPGVADPAAPPITPDGVGGLFLVGAGGLHRVLSDGRPAWLPSFAPTIGDVADVLFDEGGSVWMSITAPWAEGAGLQPAIAAYDVWRRIVPPTGPLDPTDVPPDGWEVIDHFVPSGYPTYTVVVPTRRDRSGSDLRDEAFIATARTVSPELRVSSNAILGHSVDNRAPAPLAELAGASRVSGTVRLSWRPAPEPDVDHYNVYRGVDPRFSLTAANRIGTTVEPRWDDAGFVAGASHYKVSAVDRGGNESGPAWIPPDSITVEIIIPESPVSFVNVPRPNPGRAPVTVEYGVDRSGPRTVAVYDLGGRLVRTLADGVAAAGPGAAQWDGRDARGGRAAPGLYLVRLRAVGFEATRKFVLAP